MSDKSGVNYTRVDDSYFEKRGLRRYAGVWSLWALGVGAVISGHFSGWNLGLSNGWGSMFIATIIIARIFVIAPRRSSISVAVPTIVPMLAIIIMIEVRDIPSEV